MELLVVVSSFCDNQTETISSLCQTETSLDFNSIDAVSVFFLLYKRVEYGHFSWPRNTAGLCKLSHEQYRSLMQGFSIAPPHPRYHLEVLSFLIMCITQYRDFTAFTGNFKVLYTTSTGPLSVYPFGFMVLVRHALFSYLTSISPFP